MMGIGEADQSRFRRIEAGGQPEPVKTCGSSRGNIILPPKWQLQVHLDAL